jgi:hypothetical protein
MSEKKKEQPKPPAAALEASNRHAKGPEPERLKISGYKNWEDAIAPILGKRKSPGAWSK